MNVVPQLVVAKLELQPETHPQPFRVVWADTTSLTVTQILIILWCKFLPLDVANVLLGHPWLYNKVVRHNERENTYV